MEAIGTRVQAKQRLSWRAEFHALLQVSQTLPISNKIMRSQTGVLLPGFRIFSKSSHMSYSLNSLKGRYIGVSWGVLRGIPGV